MSMLLALVLGWALPSLQDSSLSPATGLERLSMDALIEKLPRVGEEWIGPGLARVLHPASEEFTNRLQAGASLTAEQWRHALVDTGVLRVRERWPASMPFAVSIRVPAWLPTNTVLILDPQTEAGLRRACASTFSSGGTCAVPGMRDRQNQAYQELGKLPAGRHELPVHLELWMVDRSQGVFLRDWLSAYLDRRSSFELGLVRAIAGSPPLPTVMSTGELTFSIEVVPSLDDVLPAVSTPELEDAVRSSLSLTESSGEVVLWSDWKEEQSSVGLSLEIEVLEDGVVRERTRLVTNEKTGRSLPKDARGVRLDTLEAVVRDPVARSSWRIHVRGKQSGLLRCWTIDRRWSGEMELTLDELLDRGSDKE